MIKSDSIKGLPEFHIDDTRTFDDVEISKIKTYLKSKNLELGPQIGHGAIGTVYQLKSPDTVSVIKIFNENTKLDPDRGEHMAVKNVPQHPNLLPPSKMLYLSKDRNLSEHYSQSSKAVSIFMPFIPGQTLDLLFRTGACLNNVYLQIALGIKALVNQEIIHRDLKPTNIMHTPEGRVIIVDFGCARKYDERNKDEPDSPRGTPAYMPPERFAGRPPRICNSDVFCLGVMVYYSCLMVMPERVYSFGGNVIPQSIEKLSNLDEPLAKAIAGMLENDPCKRWSIDQVIGFFQNYDKPIEVTRLPEEHPSWSSEDSGTAGEIAEQSLFSNV